MDVKLALSQMIGGGAQQGQQGQLDMHEKDIVQQQKLCMEILNVANKISPGKLSKRMKYDGVRYHIKADSYLVTARYFTLLESRVMYFILQNTVKCILVRRLLTSVHM